VSEAGRLGDFLAECRQRVDAGLQRALPPESEPPELLHRAMRYAVFPGGKRLRPALAYAAALAGDGDLERATPGACAVELVHNYSLVHDDLPAMDDDAERHGKPSVHKAFGEACAILTGDALLAAGFAQLCGAARPGEAVARLAEAAGSRALVGGQVDDLAFEPRRSDLERITSIHARKTAALFRFALWAGGVAGGLASPALDRLDAYGRSYGLAFQLCDDLRDGDLQECSILHALPPERARERARALLREARAALEPLGERAWALGALANQLEGQLP
jgi:geranylgeranyl diphosphate synthase type II